ncbi:Hpt domain-containing protein [Beggiatoa alba]|nr:Hpt domain-containing protein [Beggiatoa alba]
MNLRTGITLVVMAAIILVIATLIASNWLSQEESQDRFTEATVTGKSVLWNKIITSQLDHMETGSPAVTRDRETLSALKKGTLDDFEEGEGPQTLYNRLSTTKVLDKLQLVDATGRVVFSLPTDFREITRKLVVKNALADGKIHRGIERDDDGQLVVASAFPLFVRGKMVGVGIFARDLQSSLDDFKANDGSEVFVLKARGKQEYSTDKTLLSKLKFTLPATGEQSLEVAKLKGKFYSVAMLPVKNSVGTAVAHLVTVTDYSKSYERQQSIALFSYLIIALVMVGCIVGMYWFQRMDRALREKTNDIDSMLQNLQDGVLTILPGNIIHHEYSAFVENILESKEVAGKDVMELVFSNSNLGSDTLHSIEAAISACVGEDMINFDFNRGLLVRSFSKTMPAGTKKYIDLNWAPICNEKNKVSKLMMSLKDVTELRKLEAEAGHKKRELEIIGQVISVSQEKFHEFIATSEEFIDANEKLIKQTSEKDPEVISSLFRNMHTIKGNARTYGLTHLTNFVHDAEQQYDDLRKIPDTLWEPHILLKKIDLTRAIINEYAHINDIKLGRKGAGRRGSVDKYLMVEKAIIEETLRDVSKINSNDILSLQKAVDKMHNTLALIGTQSLQTMLEDVQDSVGSLAAELHKPLPDIVLIDNGIRIKNQITVLLKNCFMHIFRNSMDHGIEAPELRQEKGKNPGGHIQLTLGIEADNMVFRYQDDGRGLALAKIKNKAISQELISQDAALSAEEIANLIFASGMSTAEQVTEVSGRGVGMEAVQKFLEREKGTVSVKLLDDKTEAVYRPMEIILCLPENFSVTLR